MWAATLFGVWAVTPTVRADLTAGYAQWRPKFRRDRQRGRWLGTGVTVAQPLGFTVGGGADLRWTDYERDSFPSSPTARARTAPGPTGSAPTTMRLCSSASAPELVLVQETRDSNTQRHDYRRTSGEPRFVRLF